MIFIAFTKEIYLYPGARVIRPRLNFAMNISTRCAIISASSAGDPNFSLGSEVRQEPIRQETCCSHHLSAKSRDLPIKEMDNNWQHVRNEYGDGGDTECARTVGAQSSTWEEAGWPLPSRYDTPPPRCNCHGNSVDKVKEPGSRLLEQEYSFLTT